jgi:hypothetical protein
MAGSFDAPRSSLVQGRGRNWRWPGELGVRFDGSVAVITSHAPAGHSPDVRALTILEAAEGGLHEVGVVTSLRLELEAGWHGTHDLLRLERRVGLLRTRGIPIALTVCGEERLPPDPLGGVAEGLATDPVEFATPITGSGLELVTRALDEWIRQSIDRLCSFADEEGQDEVAPPLPAVRMIPVDGRVHARARWVCALLETKGIRLALPERPERTKASGFRELLVQAGATYKVDVLGVAECGTWRGNEYEHLLPEEHEHLGVWEKLRPDLTRDLPQRHAMFRSLNSSQSFAYNLLAGLRKVQVLDRALEAALCLPAGSVLLERLAFEFGPAEMRVWLGESSDRYTQIDCVAWWRDQRAATNHATVFEVKLAETEFGICRGPVSVDNRRTDVCTKAADSDRLSHCYLRVPPNARTYLEHSEGYPRLVQRLGTGGRCPLAGPGYQLARNMLAARWLESHAPPQYRVERARFFVLSAAETPAVTSGSLRQLGTTPAERLEALGAGWIDARVLVDAVATLPDAQPLIDFLKRRYPPVFVAFLAPRE